MMGFIEDKPVDSIVLIGSQEDDEDGEWKGLTQTMRAMIYTKLDAVKDAMMYQITTQNEETKSEIKEEITKVSAQLNDKVEQTNRNVDLVREDLAKITSLIQQMNKTEWVTKWAAICAVQNNPTIKKINKKNKTKDK